MNQRVKVSEGQINTLRRDIARAKLTKQDLSSLPGGARTYRSVGRMYAFRYLSTLENCTTFTQPTVNRSLSFYCRFILDSVADVRQGLDKQESEAEGKIKSIEEQVAYWQKNVKESEENIRDMLMHRRDK